MKKREDIVSTPQGVSFLDFPADLWKVIPSIAQDDEAIKIKRKLSLTCKTLQSFFQPDLDKSDAERLLTYVLKGNAKEAKKVYETNPRLLFIEASAKEYAAGIDENGKSVFRWVIESPFKAAARAGDIWMLRDMKEQFGKVFDKTSQKSGDILAKEQLTEVFPHGFKYPPSTYDFTDLVVAITNDQRLKNANPFAPPDIKPGKASSNTEKVLAQFRKDFMPHHEKVGFHFNLNELIKVCEIYNNNYDQWNTYQAAVFWSQVVGYLERLVSACDAQAICQERNNLLEGQTLERTFDISLFLNSLDKVNSLYFPLDNNPFSGLGGTFGIDSWVGVREVGDRVGVASGIWGYCDMMLVKLCHLKTAGLEELKQQLHRSTDMPELPHDVKHGCQLV